MNRKLASLLALCALCSVMTFVPASALAACGNGVVEGGEECDGGPNKYIDGDPANATCTTGARCFYELTCCKFNCQFVGQGAPCQDGDSCSGPDTCNQVGVCLGGPDAANDTPCDDGLFCDGAETCQNGACESSGSPCSGTACNHCNETNDNCFDAAASPCSDGSVCITGGTCNGSGTCEGGVFNAGNCDDGVYCNGTDTCLDGACAVHTGDPCVGADGDGNCLESSNEAGSNCVGADPDGSTCDDGQFCNGDDDECTGGACAGTGTLACDDGNDCTTDGCDEGLDMCTTLGTSPDGTACDNGSVCTFDDECVGGFCVGTPTALVDLCPWALVHREQPIKDQIKTRTEIGITGDVCGGIVRFVGRPTVTGDLVADESAGTPLLIPPNSAIAGNIVSSGGGAKVNSPTNFLPYTNVETLAPGSNTAKNDASGFYDLTGTNLLATQCHAARTSYAGVTADLNALGSTATIPSVKLKVDTTLAIPSANVGGLNVIDVDGFVKIGKSASLQLTGGGSADTIVVLRVAKNLGLSVFSAIELLDGLTPDHTLIYVKGKKCLLNAFSIGSGTLLCSPGKITSQGAAWIGAIYGDGKILNVKNKSTVYHLPFSAPL